MVRIVLFILFSQLCFSAEFPEQRRTEKDLFPRPVDGEVSEVNPPAFAWLGIKEATGYQINVYKIDTNKPALTFKVENETVYAPRELFEAGQYTWTITAYDKNERAIATRQPYHLTIPRDAIEFPFPDVKKLVSRISPEHPRILFPKDQLDEIRASLATTRKDGWKAVKKMADESLDLELPEPPWYSHLSKEKEYKVRRLEYRKYYRYIRTYIDEGLQALGIAWLMTGEQKYADAGKKILLHLASWKPSEITSSNEIGFDEPGLSLARCMHRAYDWLYDALSEEERQIVRQNVIERTEDTFLRVGIKRPFHQNPGSSHDGRLIGYLSEEAIVLAGDAPDEDVKKWLEYSLTAYWTIFPHWAGRDGGWAEGIGYAATYNIRATNWIESCVTALDLDLWKKPFFQKVRDYFLYCSRPNDEFWAFGDGAERGPRSQPSRGLILRSLMSHYAQRLNDPAAQWWADQVPLDDLSIPNPVTPMLLGVDIQGQIADKDNMAVFNDVGWAAMHSDLADLENDVFFLFKSSPYGSISHSHGDQNSFYISVGGRALAIPSGYYGPVYGMPHHAEWTRSTKANNNILVNGVGQRLRDFKSNGSISDSFQGTNISYICGDASNAYDELNKFDRHVLFVRPGLFLILDDLIASESSTFQWMLHSLEEMKYDQNNNSIQSNHLGAQLNIRLFNSEMTNFEFKQTDKFDTPFNAGIEEKYHTKVQNHWHLTANLKSNTEQLRIASIMQAGNKGELGEIEYMVMEGWIGAQVSYPNGTAYVFAQMNKDAGFPEKFAKMINTDQSAQSPLVGYWKSRLDNEIFIAKSK